MNDRFKFRVWDKINKVYFGGDYGVSYYLTDSEIDGDLYCRQCDGPFDLSEDDDFIVEQCTGLKDKNGQLIYEGDILFVKTLDWKNKVKWDAEEVRTYWSVEYKDYLNHRGFMVFGINRRFHKPLTRTTIFNSEAIIVGNIHENKELLDER